MSVGTFERLYLRGVDESLSVSVYTLRCAGPAALCDDDVSIMIYHRGLSCEIEPSRSGKRGRCRRRCHLPSTPSGLFALIVLSVFYVDTIAFTTYPSSTATTAAAGKVPLCLLTAGLLSNVKLPSKYGPRECSSVPAVLPCLLQTFYSLWIRCLDAKGFDDTYCSQYLRDSYRTPQQYSINTSKRTI